MLSHTHTQLVIRHTPDTQTGTNFTLDTHKTHKHTHSCPVTFTLNLHNSINTQTQSNSVRSTRLTFPPLESATLIKPASYGQTEAPPPLHSNPLSTVWWLFMGSWSKVCERSPPSHSSSPNARRELLFPIYSP